MKEVTKLEVEDKDLDKLIDLIIKQTELINSVPPSPAIGIPTYQEREADEGLQRIKTEIRRLIHHGYKLGR